MLQIVLAGIGLGTIATASAFIAASIFSRPKFHVYKNGAVLVTGASSGIGHDAAIALTKKGYQVLACVRKDKDAQDLKAESSMITPIMLDVADKESVFAAVPQVEDSLKRLNLPLIAIVNNAGVSGSLPFEMSSVEDMQHIMNVNVWGTVHVTKAFLPFLKSNGREGGRIVNVSSLAGRVVQPTHGSYAMSKFALEALSDALRRELLRFNIHVAVIEPGYIKTPIFEKALKHLETVPRNPEYVDMMESKEAFAILGQVAAPTTQVTSDAILHAISAEKPRTRYPVGKSATYIATMSSIVPDFVLDKLVRQKFEAYPQELAAFRLKHNLDK